HIGILVPALAGGWLLVRADTDHFAVGAVPHRDAMPPPQLAADAPVMHAVDPLEVAGGHLRGVQPHPAVAHRISGRLGQRSDLDEPLLGQTWFDDAVAARA